MLDEAFYESLLTFSAVGFTVFISGAIGRYTLLKDADIERWFYRIFVILLTALAIPGVMLALSPVLILYSFFGESLCSAYYGFCTIFFAYVSAALIMIFGIIIGYGYLITESYFYKKFQKRLEKQGKKDFAVSL